MNNLNPSLNRTPGKIYHIHIMGICGTGMAALAGMLQHSGYQVTGSDMQVYPPMSTFLKSLGINVANGYCYANLQPAPDLVIVGNVITRDNQEAIALAELGLPYLSFPQALAHFFIQFLTSIVITGTHGKTTTCSLLATALFAAKLDPTFMIGGIVKEFDANYRIGKGKYFIAEGDEYDTAFFDKESKFLHYRPQIAVITSIEFDHADIFDNLNAIKRSFKKFVSLLPEDGLLIANFDDENVVEISEEARCNVESYGLNPSHTWSLDNISISGGRSCCDIIKDGLPWSSMEIALPGRHNCLNSLAVCGVMNHLGLQPDTIKKSLKKFSGVKRRQEVRGMIRGVMVIDDFAHHPTAVRETLLALKASYPQQRLIAVFEPRTNSSRRAIFQHDYADSFAAADLVMLREPEPIRGVGKDDLFSCDRLAEDLNKKDTSLKAQSFKDTDELLRQLLTVVKQNDIVAILSNGSFDNIHKRLLDKLEKHPDSQQVTINRA